MLIIVHHCILIIAKIFYKKRTCKILLELHYMALIVTCLLMENKSMRSKLVMKMLTFQCNFNGIDSREVSLNWNVYGFSVDYNAIDKCDILFINI